MFFSAAVYCSFCAAELLGKPQRAASGPLDELRARLGWPPDLFVFVSLLVTLVSKSGLRTGGVELRSIAPSVTLDLP
jgi:hypothetical protein